VSRQATGLRAWVLQRITAVYLGVYTLYLVGCFIADPPASHGAWSAWVSGPVASLAAMFFFLSLLLHAWIGIRDILIDYVHPFLPRLALLTLFGAGLVACGLWALKVIINSGAVA
jgi:succinate dehydrogenase / fumarate reductase membrane anchor subunit